MSENSESKVLYVSDRENTNSYNSEMNQSKHGGEYDEYSNNPDEYDGGMINNDSNNTDEYDGGMVNDDSNNTDEYDGGMNNIDSGIINNEESEEYNDKVSYGGSDSDNDSIDTCEILKVDPLMIRLNCFLKSQNGETIVEILKDIRDELVKLNKNMMEKTTKSSE